MEKYKLLITEISNTLKVFNYNKSGETFFYYKDNNIGVINIQRSRDSSSSATLFTINLGVYSGSLRIFDKRDLKSKPTVSDCHWRERIGFLLPQKKDYWWQIDESTSMSELIAEITNILKELAIHEIQKYITDDNLEKYWMSGGYGSLSKQGMYLYLIALLKANNKPVFRTKVDELLSFSKGKPFYQNVKENLKKIGITDA